jgi:hypothetical protein
LRKSYTLKYPPFGQCSPLFGVNCIEEEAAQQVAMVSLKPPAPRAIPTAPPAWLPYLRFEIQPDALRLVYYRHET